jgi:hypothetical protein
MAKFGVLTGSLYLSPQNAVKLPSTGGEKLPAERREMSEGVIRDNRKASVNNNKGTPARSPWIPTSTKRDQGKDELSEAIVRSELNPLGDRVEGMERG